MQFSKKEEYLREKDKKLKKIIDENGHIVFKPNKDHQFDTLVGIVVSQFISTKAANSIFLKIKKNLNSKFLNQKDFEKLSINDIKNLGLSMNKAKSIKKLSELYLSEELSDLTILSDEELSQKLLSVFGIGPWSLNMFQIFCLGKLDIFSSRDAGLRLGMNNCRMVKSGSEFNKYEEYAELWSPYKTIASIHLWKTVD
tara:strand:- start:1815 stop:2408 length:594 start_codon:yes stop_codon:yes gene_type:complete